VPLHYNIVEIDGNKIQQYNKYVNRRLNNTNTNIKLWNYKIRVTINIKYC
jgi:hypothetical protein